MICPIHAYALGQCPGCDTDPRPMIRHYLDRPASAWGPSVAAHVAYQVCRLPSLRYLEYSHEG